MSQRKLAESKKYYTVEEYLAFERKSEEKHEYSGGKIIAMAGASREHNLIGTNIGTEIRFRLKGKPCETYISDMRVRVKSNRYCYPDVVIACDKPQFADDDFDILLNPVIVVEILSASTKFRDKTEKLEEYRKIDSLKECLLIEQSKIFIEHYIKQTPNQWLLRIYENADEILNLESIGCEIPLSDIYLQVEFGEILQ